MASRSRAGGRCDPRRKEESEMETTPRLKERYEAGLLGYGAVILKARGWAERQGLTGTDRELVAGFLRTPEGKAAYAVYRGLR